VTTVPEVLTRTRDFRLAGQEVRRSRAYPVNKANTATVWRPFMEITISKATGAPGPAHISTSYVKRSRSEDQTDPLPAAGWRESWADEVTSRNSGAQP
jgi:hypothetical protein